MLLGRAVQRGLRANRTPPLSVPLRPLTASHSLLLPHVPLDTQRRRDTHPEERGSPFLLPSAGLHTTPAAEHGYVNPKFPKRPISPHVTIYAFPTVAWSSITMRVSGVFLSIGCAAVGGLACMDPAAPVELMSLLGSSPMLAIPAKVAVSFPLVYHFAGALRHTVRLPPLCASDGSPVEPFPSATRCLACLRPRHGWRRAATRLPRLSRLRLSRLPACICAVLGPDGSRAEERGRGEVQLHGRRHLAGAHRHHQFDVSTGRGARGAGLVLTARSLFSSLSLESQHPRGTAAEGGRCWLCLWLVC